ncbi:methyltransferase [Marinicaulis aureus]|uniref:Methyltransferase n=1 Tax=Hyphococcus aureus TaxID=2666033 RepID=A0ABW1KRX1_9PROT
MSEQASPQDQILGIVNNYWQGCAVGAAAELEIADHLADGPLDIAALAERTKTHASSLYRMLRALESTGIFTQVSSGAFANTPASECLRRRAPNSSWAWLRVTLSSNGMVNNGWRGLMVSLKEGKPGFEELNGCTGWEYMQANPEQGAVFNEAMRDLAAAITPAVTGSYDWGRFPVIADLGGGVGSQLIDILDAHPDCRGVLFDQPQVITQAPEHRRMEPLGGDFFSNIPQADAYLLRWILHDWDDAQARAILKNVHAAAKPGAALMIVESVIPESAEFDMGKWMDLNMMVMAGGRERTANEFRVLFDQAGFDFEEIVETPSPLSIVVGKARD